MTYLQAEQLRISTPAQRLDIETAIYKELLTGIPRYKGGIRFAKVHGSAVYNTPNESSSIELMHSSSDIDYLVCFNDPHESDFREYDIETDHVQFGGKRVNRINVSVRECTPAELERELTSNDRWYWSANSFARISLPLVGEEEYLAFETRGMQRLLLRALRELPDEITAVTPSAAVALVNQQRWRMDPLRWWSVYAGLFVSGQRERNKAVYYGKVQRALDHLVEETVGITKYDHPACPESLYDISSLERGRKQADVGARMDIYRRKIPLLFKKDMLFSLRTYRKLFNKLRSLYAYLRQDDGFTALLHGLDMQQRQIKSD